MLNSFHIHHAIDDDVSWSARFFCLAFFSLVRFLSCFPFPFLPQLGSSILESVYSSSCIVALTRALPKHKLALLAEAHALQRDTDQAFFYFWGFPFRFLCQPREERRDDENTQNNDALGVSYHLCAYVTVAPKTLLGRCSFSCVAHTKHPSYW